MTLLWVLAAIGASIIALLAYLGVRDRRRLSSAEDTAAARVAGAAFHRHDAAHRSTQAGRHIENSDFP